MVDRRKDPNYEQVTGHVQRDLARQFKVFCTDQRITIAEALDTAITLFLQQTNRDLEPTKPQEAITPTDLKAFLTQLAYGELPTNGQLVTLAHDLGIPTETLMAIRERMSQQKKKGKTNGS